MAQNSTNDVLVIGAQGLIGRQVANILTEHGVSWKGTFFTRPAEGLLKLDITDPASVTKVFTEVRPRAVFHCANLAGGVDFCETNPKRATAFHLSATKEIGAWCVKIGAPLVFLSTDYIFDGMRGPYKEDDATNPLNSYGVLKFEAERLIQASLTSFIIVRTTNVYGWDPDTKTPNYIMALYRALKEGKPFNAPSYLWGNPTYVDDLARAVVELWEGGANGIFHVVGGSFVNRHEWVLEACRVLGLDASLAKEIKFPSPNMVQRPMRSWLNPEKFTSSYRTVLHSMAEGLELMKADMQNSQYPV